MKGKEVNMEVRDIIPIIISIISLVVSIISGILVYLQTYKINKYEFMSKERTKKDILDLLSALNLIMEKSTCAHLIKVNFEKEKDILLNFLLSDTWMITRYIIKDENDFIMTSTKFFIIIYNTDGFIGDIAKALGEEINNIYIQYFDDVIKEKERLKKNIGKYSKESKFNNGWYDLRKKNEDKLNQENIQKIKAIKEKGVIDSNLDIWLGLLTNDDSMLKKGIENGGDVNISLNDALKKYISS